MNDTNQLFIQKNRIMYMEHEKTGISNMLTVSNSKINTQIPKKFISIADPGFAIHNKRSQSTSLRSNPNK